MAIARILAGLAGIILTVYIVWGFMAAPFWESVSVIMANPWGVVTVVDLYTGFILSGILIAVLEPKKRTVPLWVIPIFFLGNVVTAAWIVFRLRAAVEVRRAGAGSG